MKKFFTLAAIALTLGALTVACHNTGDTDENDTVTADTIVDEIDTVAIDTVATDTVVTEEPAPAKTGKKKAATKKKDEAPSTTKASINSPKKNPVEAAGELKQGSGSQVQGKQMSTTKPKAADAFKKN